MLTGLTVGCPFQGCICLGVFTRCRSDVWWLWWRPLLGNVYVRRKRTTITGDFSFSSRSGYFEPFSGADYACDLWFGDWMEVWARFWGRGVNCFSFPVLSDGFTRDLAWLHLESSWLYFGTTEVVKNKCWPQRWVISRQISAGPPRNEAIFPSEEELDSLPPDPVFSDVIKCDGRFCVWREIHGLFPESWMFASNKGFDMFMLLRLLTFGNLFMNASVGLMDFFACFVLVFLRSRDISLEKKTCQLFEAVFFLHEDGRRRNSPLKMSRPERNQFVFFAEPQRRWAYQSTLAGVASENSIVTPAS